MGVVWKTIWEYNWLAKYTIRQNFISGKQIYGPDTKMPELWTVTLTFEQYDSWTQSVIKLW